MNKAQLARRIAAAEGIDAKTARRSIDYVLSGIVGATLDGYRVSITGFGSFEPDIAPARISRNPLTGEDLFVPEKEVVRFRPGARFLAFLRRERPVVPGEQLVAKDPKTPKTRKDVPS